MSDLINPSGEPLSRVLVWKNGVNNSDKGPAIWNERARSITMAVYRQRDNLVLIDVNHNMSEEERAARLAAGITEEPPTAGYCKLEVDATGALWMIPQYSEYARAKICSREMRYLSPEFAYDTRTREVIDIIRISLVHEPATWGARLVASAARRKWSKVMPPEMMAALMDLAAMLEKEQVSDAIKQKVSEVISMASGNGAPVVDESLAADDPAKKNPTTLPMTAALAASRDPAARYKAERAALEATSLIEVKIERFGKDLVRGGAKPLTAAEEAELLKIKDPAELDRTIATLRAGPRAKASEVLREEIKRPDPKAGDMPQAKAGGYVAALYKQLGINGGAS